MLNGNGYDVNSHRGRITFKQGNIKSFKKDFLKNFKNIFISILCGFVGALIFNLIFFYFYKVDESKISFKYDCNITDVINKLNQSVVGVSSYIKNNREGGDYNLTQNNMTGVLYSEDGYIVTNFFGLKDADKIYVKIPTTVNLVREAKVIGYNEKYDLCLLKIEGDDYIRGVFRRHVSDVTHGMRLISMGNSSGGSNSYSVYSGIVNGFDKFDDSFRVVKTDLKINKLNTGGPITDINGEIIGIVSTFFNENNNSHNEMSFVLISSQDIIKLIEEMIEGAT